ncbi:MAG: hypothetical protein JRM80_02880 [Nitrososphaerota archaeon]|nr:hypothetical protein [Nitrososphaerota archaeon]
MPAASYSSSVSWAAYFAAALALVAACSPVLAGVKNYSCGASASRTAEGAVEVVDGLRPGMVVAFSFRAPSADDRIELVGHSLTALWCGRASTFQTVWELPGATLMAGRSYYLKLASCQVEVDGHV